MKIAILNAFPNLSHSPEREFIQRSLVILNNSGHQALGVVTSDDIMEFNPDFVLITHELVAKLTHHFTVGLLWSPTQFYKEDLGRIRAIRSWDLVVPINNITRQFARDIHFPMRHLSAVSGLNFYPSAPISDLPIPDPSKLSLAYVGAHWDGLRHKNLLHALATVVDLHVYGPPEAWGHMPGQYRGSIPFDGDSVVRTLNRHGAVLAIHKDAHIEEDTPSMRVFESCAAKCLVFTDPILTLVDTFGDSVSYVDLARSPNAVARTIADTMNKYRSDPILFAERITRATAIFQARFSLESLLAALVEEVERRRAALRMAELNDVEDSDVTIIIRCGSRPLSMVQRAVASVESQTFKRIGIVFARYAEIEGFGDWLKTLRNSGRFLFATDLATRGNGVRSVAMWAGLRTVQTEFFCMLDDDDELFPGHLAELVEVLRKNPEVDFTYSGVIRQEEDGLFLNGHMRFKGDMNQRIRERRALQFFSDYNFDRLLRFDNYIQSNTWLARRRVLTPEVLDDPEMEVCEDMYFYLLLASRHRFLFSGTVSAIWNWRSRASDNSVTSVSKLRWANAGERLLRRLAQVPFKGGHQGRDVLGRGLDGRWNFPPEVSIEADDVGPSGDADSDVASDHPELGQGGLIGPSTVNTSGERRGKKRFSWRSLLHLGRSSKNSAVGTAPKPVEPGHEDQRSDFVLENDLAYNVDFRADRLPFFVEDIHGLSTLEKWGRWTVGPKFCITFRSPLPKIFTLQICGHAFHSNHELPIIIKVGRERVSLVMSSKEEGATYRATIVNQDEAKSILFIIPNPQAPSQLWPEKSTDRRSLGIGLVKLGLIERDGDAQSR